MIYKKSTQPRRKLDDWAQLLLILALLMPLVALFLLPGGAMFGGGHWFWIGLLICSSLIWMILGSPAAAEIEVRDDESSRMLASDEQS